MSSHIVGFFKELWAWWNSDSLSSKSIRIPLKLAVVGTLAVTVLAAGLYGAAKVRAYAGDEQPATSAQLTEFRSQIISACAPASKAAPAKKSSKR